MPESELLCEMNYKEIGVVIGGLIALGGFLITWVEFRKNNRTRRAEFLEKLTAEFNDSRMFLAKRILDDFWIETGGTPDDSDAELIRLGSGEKIEKDKLKEKVKGLLRHHREGAVTGYGEQKARQSFDDMLDFFTKLKYYLDLGLISPKELAYFTYYLEKCAYKADGAVLKYASDYEYDKVLDLITDLGRSNSRGEK